MKKIIITIFIFILPLTAAKAIEGVNIGVSLTGGVFETSAKETEGDEISAPKDAEALYAIGSIFVEKTLGDKFAIGFDYVPHALETETSEHIQDDLKGVSDGASSSVTNKVQVDFEDMMTLYGTLALNDNIYFKAGYTEVDMVTNENLGTGSTYGNKTLDGIILGLGYNRDLDSGVFVRAEGNWMKFDGVTLTSTNNSDNSVTADDIDGFGARISVGKSF